MNMMCLFCIELEIHPYKEKGTSNFGISWFFVLCGQHGSVQMPEQCNNRRAESMWKDDVHKTIISVCRRFV